MPRPDTDKPRGNVPSSRARDQKALRRFAEAARSILTSAESSQDAALRRLAGELRDLLTRLYIKPADATPPKGPSPKRPSPATARAAAASALRALAPVFGALADALDTESDAAAFERAAVEWIPLRDTGISTRTLRRAIRAGELPASRVGTHFRVRRSDLEKWIDGRRVKPHETHDDPSPAGVAERAIAKAVAEGRIRVGARRQR